MLLRQCARLDQYGFGWQASYGYNIVFPESSETYAAGVWIADTDGIVHSSEMTIQNSFFPTTTTSSTSTTSTTIAMGNQNISATTTNQQAPATTLSDLIVDDGAEDEFAELLVRRRILTSRNLSGGTLILVVQGTVVDRISIG